MQLILAIDSDPRRSEQLASLVRAKLRVELVQAKSAGEGLHALKDRVPDLILTAPLLSPFDDGVLDEYLRDLGIAGAHVQTVRIPMLSAAPKKKALANRLLLLGRTKTTSSPAAPDGCDPTVFADEIEVYLSRAAEARQRIPQIAQALAPRSEEAPSSPVVASPVISTPRISDFEDVSESFIGEFVDASEPEPQYGTAPPRQYFNFEPDEPRFVKAVESPSDLITEPMGVEPVESVLVEKVDTPTPVIETTPEPQPLVSSAPTETAPGTSKSFEAALAAIRAAWAKPEAPAPPSSSTAENVTPRSASHGELDLITSAPSDGRETKTPDRRLVQDEWGVYDPDQGGFPALVDKLDEVTDSKETPNRTIVTTRAISIR